MNASWRWLLLAVFVALVSAQFPIPPRPNGFAQGSSDSPVVIELFGDLLCPDTKDVWPIVKSLLSYYNAHQHQPTKRGHRSVTASGDQLRVVLHLFPLPYHNNAFYAAQGAQVVQALTGSSQPVFAYVEAVFAAQNQFVGVPDKSPNTVIGELGALAAANVPGITAEAFVKAFSNSTENMAARMDFKLSATRGVAATPTYHVNGVPFLAADSTWTDVQWHTVIDQLLSGQPYDG